MGKSRRKMQRGEKSDYNLEARLKEENKKLKRELRKLRNLIKRADLQRLEHLEKLTEQQRKLDKELSDKKSKVREKWRCHDCRRGFMVPRKFKRRDGDFYYRICNNYCGNKTRMKKLTKDVDLSMLEEE